MIFDSHSVIGAGVGVYAEAVGEEVPAAEIEAMKAVFTARSLAQGGEALTLTDAHRLYQATPTQLFLLGERDQRVPISLD